MDRKLQAIINEIAGIGGILGFCAKLCLNDESKAKQFVKDMRNQLHHATYFTDELKQAIINYLEETKLEHGQ